MAAFVVEEQKPEDTGSDWGEAVCRSRGSTKSRKSGTEQVVEFILGNELFAVDLFDTRRQP